MPGTNYPTALDTTSSLRTVTDAVDDVLAIDQNYPRDAIIAAETKLGYGADTPTVGEFLVGNTTAGTSQWRVVAAADLPTTLTGINDLQFNTAPTVGSFVEGKIYYDAANKTFSAMIDTDVTLQMGQEMHGLVYNDTASTITPGQLVYLSGGASGDFPKVKLAKADARATSNVFGMATQSILAGATGLVTTFGKVHELNTTGLTAGNQLYLSAATAGAYTETQPALPNFSVKIGHSTNINASTGSISMELEMNNRLEDLDDVSITAAVAGDRLAWNGSAWIATQATSAVGSAAAFYPDNTIALADNKTLTTTPTSYTEIANTVAVTAATSPVFFERFVSGTLGRTSIPAGNWTFNIWAAPSSTAGNNVIQWRVNKRVIQTGMTGTFTGAGATRTFTVTGGTPFVAGDANASRLLAGLIETPNQTAWISAFTSSSVVTVTLTDAGYVNESGVALNAIYYYLFNDTTPDMSSTTPTLYTVTSTQAAFTGLNLTDRLVWAVFATADGNRNSTLYYGGNSRFSYFTSPISTLHNDLAGLNAGDYQHFTAAQATPITTAATSGKILKSNGTNFVASTETYAAPGTSGNLMTSDGTNWTSAAAPVSVSVTTKGDLQTFSTVPARLPVGTDGYVLESRASETTGLKWVAASAGGAASVVNSEAVSGTKNGTNTAFTLANTPVTGSVLLYLNGQRLTVTGDYTISGTAITMVIAPQSTDILLADYLISSGAYATGSASFVSNETPSGLVNSSNQTFTLVSTPVTGTLALYRDGQLMVGGGADYTLTTNSIAFVTAPVTGSVLLAFYQSAASTAGNADLLDGLHASTFQDAELTGWYPISETFTYASASTITIASGGASRYQVGDKLKWTQTTVKYGVIVTVADTLLTIAVNTDYVVTNATISNVYVSRVASPFGFPDWFNYSPTIAWSNTAPSGTTITKSKYSIKGRSVFVKIWQDNTVAGSGNIQVTFSVPVTSVDVGTGTYPYIAAGSSRVSTTQIEDNAGLIVSQCFIQRVSPSHNILVAFASSAVKSMAADVFYEI